MIPLSKCNEAADLLIKWFEPKELINIVGGERWWQVRGLDGIEVSCNLMPVHTEIYIFVG